LLKDTQPDRVVETIAAIEMSFGAIQLEDFAAPECFEIEARLQARLRKPVLHDDQHGTAVQDAVGGGVRDAAGGRDAATASG
jgi:malic enzyme